MPRRSARVRSTRGGIPKWAMESGKNLRNRRLVNSAFTQLGPAITAIGDEYQIPNTPAWVNQAGKIPRPRTSVLAGIRTMQDALNAKKDAKRAAKWINYNNAIAEGVSRFPGQYPQQFYRKVYGQNPPAAVEAQARAPVAPPVAPLPPPPAAIEPAETPEAR